ncbi:MAG: hypothetical protein KDA97_00520, partial [Acidimicrobiales bacterium]|nr:hypothetical protein [Acidimicrobiales bacterium]
SEEAAASPLRRFTSCAELSAWGELASGTAGGATTRFETVGSAVADDGVGLPSTTLAAPTAAEAAGADAGATRSNLNAGEAEALDETNVVV